MNRIAVAKQLVRIAKELVASRLWEKPLDNWAKQVTKKLPKRIRDLIAAANQDLYYGPGSDMPGYPGFTKACREIERSIDKYVSDLWVDTQSGEVFDKEPEAYKNPDYDPDDPDSGPEYEEPMWEDWVHIDEKQVKEALVGKELAQFL